MKRISTNMSNQDMQYHMRLREYRMNDLQNKMGEQKRIQRLRDDPIGAARAVQLESKIGRATQFYKNVETVQGNLRIAETYLRSAVEIVQRVRELAVQGANDTYTKQDKQFMAEEINQLLNELVEIGNARLPDGSTIFSGDRIQTIPFRSLSGRVEGASSEVITQVDYIGSLARNQAEISEQSFIETGLPGGSILWAEQQQIFGERDATNFQVLEDVSLFIDGKEIPLLAGDNISAVIAKINDAGLAVRANLDPVKNSLVLSSTVPHQLWVEDAPGGTVLQDLGIISGHGKPPHNLSKEAVVSGGSIFDMVIYLRNALYKGDTVEIGGGALKGLDNGISNLLTSLTKLGAQDERLTTVANRIDYELPELQNQYAQETGLDLTSAIMELKMLEYTHKAALQTAARILPPTLLDYLR